MKKIFLTLAIALLTFSIQVKADNTKIMNNGDTTVIIDNGDTTQISGLPMIGNIIKKALDDTVSSSNPAFVEENDHEYNSSKDDEWFYRNQEGMHNMVENIVQYIVVGCVFIILLALLFYFLHRRAKYRMIEKAIENNYPLPDGVLGNARICAPQANRYAQPDGNIQPNQPDAAQNVQIPPQPFRTDIPNMTFNEISPYLNWRAFKKSFTMIVTGLVFMLLFWTVGATPLIAIFSIVLIIGLANGFVTYQEQKRLIVQQVMQQSRPATAPQQPAAPQQPQDNQQQPPVFTPEDNN